MPSSAIGRMIEQRQMAMMPTMSRLPNSRIIGTRANLRAAKASTASKVTTTSPGPRLRAASWIGWASRSMTTSSSIRACICTA